MRREGIRGDGREDCGKTHKKQETKRGNKTQDTRSKAEETRREDKTQGEMQRKNKG